MDDLRSIYSYIAFKLKEPDIAKKLVDKIRNDIRKLDEQPKRCAPVEWEPWKSMGMRKLPIGNYVVLYLTDNGQKEVGSDGREYQQIEIYYSDSCGAAALRHGKTLEHGLSIGNITKN